MTPAQWQRAKSILEHALELPVHDRTSYVERTCDHDADLKEHCLALLRHAEGWDAQIAADGPSGIAPGLRIAERYRVERQLARGGFATAWLAVDEQLHGRRVVIKVLTSTVEPGWSERKFDEELRAISAIDDPSVVAPLGAGRLVDGTPYIVMQFVEGCTLADLMKQASVSLQRAAGILRQTGRALGAVHRQKIFHRDVKPGNIMVQALATGGDHVRLIDFGISSLAQSNDPSPLQTMIVGTLPYMAPEQLAGRPGRASDVYALAAVAYELVTGVRPVPVSSREEVTLAPTSGIHVPPSRLCASVSAAADRLILNGLSYEPAARPDDIAAWAAELADELVQAQPVNRAPDRTSRLTPSLLAGMTAAALVIAAFVYLRSTPVTTTAASWLPSSLPAGTATAPAPQLSVALLSSNAAGNTRRIAEQVVSLAATDTFRLEVVPNQPGHLYIYSEDSQAGSFNVLYPSPERNENSSFESAGQPLLTRLFAPDPEPGTARLWVVWSKHPVETLETSARWANRQFRGEIQDRGERETIGRILADARVSARRNPANLIFVGSGDLVAAPMDVLHR